MLPAAESALDLDFPAPDVASDVSGAVSTVQEVPRFDTSNFHQRRSLMASVGRLVAVDDGPATAKQVHGFARLSAGRPIGALRFPDGSTCVTVDDRGRIKATWAPTDSGDRRRSVPVGEQLGWVDGAVDVVMVDGWAVLTQPAELAPTPSRRHSHLAQYSSKLGRLQLRVAHLSRLGVEPKMPLLMAPVFERRALIAVSPDAALAPTAPPEHVIDLCLPDEFRDDLLTG